MNRHSVGSLTSSPVVTERFESNEVDPFPTIVDEVNDRYSSFTLLNTVSWNFRHTSAFVYFFHYSYRVRNTDRPSFGGGVVLVEVGVFCTGLIFDHVRLLEPLNERGLLDIYRTRR